MSTLADTAVSTKVLIEAALGAALARAKGPATPPTLHQALDHAVFPGGARVRPRLCLAVAGACGLDRPKIAEGAAAAIELLHCASLVHDDLPCFDDAETRRGRPSVHAAFGEPLAVLVGDALIVAAFETLAQGAAADPERIAGLTTALARAVGAGSGLVAGQAWESEPAPPLDLYHDAKTGALFVAATTCGALAAGADADPWRDLGRHLGAAYQVADDLRDAVCSPEELGKPAHRDEALSRPSAVARLGIPGAVRALAARLDDAVAAIPPCEGAAALEQLVLSQAKRLLPDALRETAA